jgi:hypothetical protein
VGRIVGADANPAEVTIAAANAPHQKASFWDPAIVKMRLEERHPIYILGSVNARRLSVRVQCPGTHARIVSWQAVDRRYEVNRTVPTFLHVCHSRLDQNLLWDEVMANGNLVGFSGESLILPRKG